MADFQDIVNELKKTNQKLDKVAAASDPSGAAAAEDKADEQRRANEQTDLLRGILGALSGGSGGAAPTEDKKSGGIFGGIGRAMGMLGAGVGRGIGGFMTGIAAGAVAGPAFVIAMGALGAGLAAFGILIAGAGWVVSQMMPDIADGLKAFDGINGMNLIRVGGGIAALGGGFAVMGAGSAILGVGNLIGSIADGLTGLFGGKSGEEAIVDKLIRFSELELNTENIKNNSEAMMAYGIAMTAGGAGTALEAIGGFVAGVFTGLTNLIGGVPTVDKLRAFGSFKVDKAAVINNSEAMGEYAIAMVKAAGAAGAGALGSVFNFVSVAFDSLSGLLGGEGMLDTILTNMKKISAAEGIDAEKIRIVSEAMGVYTIAMAKSAGAAGISALGEAANFVGQGFKALSELVGGEGMLGSVLTGMQTMSAATGIDKDKIVTVSEAMAAYTIATYEMMKSSGTTMVGEIANFVGTGFKALTELIGGAGVLETTLAGMKTMSGPLSDGIDKDKIVNVGQAIAAYGVAMENVRSTSKVTLGAEVINFVSGALNALSGLFGADDSLTTTLKGMKTMSDYDIKDIDVEKIKHIGVAMSAYGVTMQAGADANPKSVWDSIGSFASGLIDSINPFSGDDNPVKKLKEFAEVEISKEELDKIQANASAFTVYATAVGSMGDLNKLFGEGGKAPDLKSFAESLNESVEHLIPATAKLAAPELTKQFKNAGQNLGTFFDAFRNIEGMGSKDFMGSDDINDFSKDLVKAIDNFEKAGPVVGQILVSRAAERNANAIANAAGVGGGGGGTYANINANTSNSSVNVNALPLNHPDRIAAQSASATGGG
jgi:hypothetical protein